MHNMGRNGYVVLPALTEEEVANARAGLHKSLSTVGVDVNNLEATAPNIRYAGNGVGGIVEMYYQEWKLALHQHPKLFGTVAALWNATYASGKTPGYETPLGSFDPSRGYIYIDRAGFRIPDRIIQMYPVEDRAQPLQFGVHPHFDCDPLALWGAAARAETTGMAPRWRPLQAFVSLTDSLIGNEGGFEAVPGFHKHFEEYFRQRPWGQNNHEFYSLVPGAHDDVLSMFRHIDVQAGDIVVWDWRLAHSNAHKHTGDGTREVVYLGYLPDVHLNHDYAEEQADKYKHGEAPPDFSRAPLIEPSPAFNFTSLGYRLMGLVNCTKVKKKKNKVKKVDDK
mmetsp:Transcript_12413/g.29099  ORF Transcript_12413/g.29099 Transcript_12413/m.29099 type:complete len:337 (+) Transcript_12413:189-1199(+)